MKTGNRIAWEIIRLYLFCPGTGILPFLGAGAGVITGGRLDIGLMV